MVWSPLLLFLTACSPYEDKPLFPSDATPIVLWGALSANEQIKVMKDTITPPMNPMTEKPIPDNSFHFRGVLCLEYFDGELYCAIRNTRNDYFLADDDCTYLLRLNDPMLKNYVVGDTIVVTARPIKHVNDLSLITYYIQPNK